MTETYIIADLPSIQRDLYLARCLRRVDDCPINIETLSVKWEDMTVKFVSNEAISGTTVEVREDISLSVFSRRMESLLDCGAHDGAQEWILKWSDHISRYGEFQLVRRLLCDKIASIDGETGETVGVMKIKRRSVKAGYAKIRLVPPEDSLQVIVRHTSAQGLKAVWKSVLWRLTPVGREKTITAPITAPCVIVREKRGDYYYDQKAIWLSENGMSVDMTRDIDVILPLERFAGRYFSSNRAKFYCRVEIQQLPAGKPEEISINGKVIEISTRDWSSFFEKATKLSDWLGLGWNLGGDDRVKNS